MVVFTLAEYLVLLLIELLCLVFRCRELGLENTAIADAPGRSVDAEYLAAPLRDRLVRHDNDGVPVRRVVLQVALRDAPEGPLGAFLAVNFRELRRGKLPVLKKAPSELQPRLLEVHILLQVLRRPRPRVQKPDRVVREFVALEALADMILHEDRVLVDVAQVRGELVRRHHRAQKRRADDNRLDGVLLLLREAGLLQLLEVPVNLALDQPTAALGLDPPDLRQMRVKLHLYLARLQLAPVRPLAVTQ